MRTIWLSLSFAWLVAAVPVPAAADCQCVAAGKRYPLGEIACIRLPEGDRLARCAMVLNNSSWTNLQQACPVGFDGSSRQTRMAAADGHSHADGHGRHHALGHSHDLKKVSAGGD